jgi:hypothetical protein
MILSHIRKNVIKLFYILEKKISPIVNIMINIMINIIIDDNCL